MNVVEAILALLGIPPPSASSGSSPGGIQEGQKKEGPPRKALEEIVFEEKWK